ncbi:MAG: hypothetical protein ACYDH6_07195 [Acidimicrobiales bacterium]
MMFGRRKKAQQRYDAGAVKLAQHCVLTSSQVDDAVLAYPASLRLSAHPARAGARRLCWQGVSAGGSPFLLLHSSLTRGGSGGGGPTTEFLDTVRIEVPEAAGLPRLVVAPKGHLGAWSQGFYSGVDMDVALWPEGMRKLKLGSRIFDRRYDIGVGRGADDARLRDLFQTEFIEWLASDTHRTYYELIDGTLDAFWVRTGRPYPPEELTGLLDLADRYAERVRVACLRDNAESL